MNNQILTCVRVSYAKHDVPIKKREYTIEGTTCPVGCINELIEHVVKKYNYTHMVLKDIDGQYDVDIVTGKATEIKNGTIRNHR